VAVLLGLEVCFKEVNTLVIPNKDKSATNGTKHICKVTLEESFGTLVFDDFPPAIKCTLVHLLSLARHHHKTSTHCIKGIGHRHRTSRYSLSNSKSCEESRADPTRTRAQPMERSTFVKLPLKRALAPSSLMIFLQQSSVPLYIFSPSPDIIIRRLRTVSKG